MSFHPERMVVAWLALVLAHSAAHADVTLLAEDRFARTTLDGTHYCSPETHEICVCDPGSIYYPFCSALPPPGPYSQLDEVFGTGFTDLEASVQVDAATASQSSSIGTAVIEGNGTVDADSIAEYDIGEPVSTGTEASTTATSRVHVTFSVDEPMPYSLVGSWSGVYPFFAQVTVQMRLTDGVTPIAEIPCHLVDPEFPPSGCMTTDEVHRGVLAPGTYELEVEAYAVGDPGELGGPPAIFGQLAYEFRLGLGPASAVPGLGGLARVIAALAVAAAGASALWRARAARAL